MTQTITYHLFKISFFKKYKINFIQTFDLKNFEFTAVLPGGPPNSGYAAYAFFLVVPRPVHKKRYKTCFFMSDSALLKHQAACFLTSICVSGAHHLDGPRSSAD